MEPAHEPLAKGFGYREPDEIDPDLIPGIAGNRSALALEAPVIAYYYRGEAKYFGFGVAVPEGSVIPMEIFESGSPFLDSVSTWVNPQSGGIAIGDQIQVQWTALDGSAWYRSETVTVVDKDKYLVVAIPDSEIIRFEGKTTEVIFVHLPQTGGAQPSPSSFVYVAPALGLKPVLQVEGVVDGVLDTTAYPDGIEVSIAPIENMRSYNAMEILWIQEPDNWLERQRRMTVYPQDEMGFLIDPVVYQPHVGKRVTIKYFIYLGAKLSPNFFWSVGSANVTFTLI